MATPSKRSYPAVINHYEKLRKQARTDAYAAIPSVIVNRNKGSILKESIALDGFTFDCYREVRKWENTKGRRVAWNWHDVNKSYQSKPKRFELSIWYRAQTLGSASIGKPTWSGAKLRMDFIEANPEGSPLDGLIVDLNLLCYRVYAKAIGATQLRIMHPVNPTVRDYYLSKPGFSYNEKENFCYQDI